MTYPALWLQTSPVLACRAYTDGQLGVRGSVGTCSLLITQTSVLSPYASHSSVTLISNHH